MSMIPATELLRSLMRPLVLASAVAFLLGASLAARPLGSVTGGGPLDCTVQVVQGGTELSGLRVSLMPEGRAPSLGRAGPATDLRGRMTVQVSPSSIYRPYLEHTDHHGGFALLVLASIKGERASGFCRQEEIIELPDTLVRVRVEDAVDGTLVANASLGVDNVGVRLEGRPPSDRGVVTLKARTGDDGEVEIPGLAPGRWRITADTSDPPHIAGQSRTWRAERTIELHEGDSVLVELALEEYDRELQVDAEGRLQMYRETLEIDDDEALEDALRELERSKSRYMTAERFGRIEEGMTQQEVVRVGGLVELNRIYYLEGGVMAWLYPRKDLDRWAAVYFERGEDGKSKVYATAFDAETPWAEPESP